MRLDRVSNHGYKTQINLKHHVSYFCFVFYIIIYKKYWCWCQVVSVVFVLHTIYVVQIGHQHCLIFSTEIFIICQKWMMWYDIFRPQKIVPCDPKYVLFCKYNLETFLWTLKQSCLKMIFLSTYLVNAVCVAVGVLYMQMKVFHHGVQKYKYINSLKQWTYKHMNVSSFALKHND